MYEQNLNYFKELTMYILAGKKKLEETRNGKLAEMKNKAALSGLPEDAQAARDLDEKCSRFEKKLHDLALTRTIAMQTAPQIRLIQNNDTVMVEKIQTTIVNTIPLWKSQMVLALGIAHSAEAAQAQRQVEELRKRIIRVAKGDLVVEQCITEAKKLYETVNDPHEWDVAVSYLKKRYGADAVDEAIKIEHLEM